MSLSYMVVCPIPISVSQEEISNIFQTLGTKDEVVEALTGICEHVNWVESNEANTLEISGSEYWIEFDAVSENKPMIDFLITDDDHYFGERVFEVLDQICQETGWRVFDSISGVYVNVLTWEEETEWHVPEAITYHNDN